MVWVNDLAGPWCFRYPDTKQYSTPVLNLTMHQNPESPCGKLMHCFRLLSASGSLRSLLSCTPSSGSYRNGLPEIQFKPPLIVKHIVTCWLKTLSHISRWEFLKFKMDYSFIFENLTEQTCRPSFNKHDLKFNLLFFMYSYTQYNAQ